MFDDTSREWAESGAKDLEEHQEKKVKRWRLKNRKEKKRKKVEDKNSLH